MDIFCFGNVFDGSTGFELLKPVMGLGDEGDELLIAFCILLLAWMHSGGLIAPLQSPATSAG